MRIEAILPALLACCAPAVAQNINQSVQVTNEYETKFADFQKLGVDSQVPDSLYEFDYSFDYSVFDSPYRGSYEFTPYEVRITPEPMAYDGSGFLLRAGAGYAMHPVLDVYWTAVRRDDFTFGLTNRGSGYAGTYASRPSADGGVAFSGFSGYDLADSFSLDGHWIMRGADLRFMAGYDGMFTGANDVSDRFVRGSLNSGHVSVELASAEKSRAHFSYKLGAGYRFSHDSRVLADAPAGQALPGGMNSSEHNLDVYGTVGPVLNGGKFAFLLDFDFETEFLYRPAGYADLTLNHGVLTPHVAFRLGVFDFDAGVDIDYLHDGQSGGFNFAPALDVSVGMFSGSTRAYAGLTGGRSLLSLYGLKSMNHFYTGLTAVSMSTREKFGAFLGVEGRIGGHLQYDLHGGYSSRSAMPFEAFRDIGFADADFVYASLDAKWISERLDIEAGLDWRHLVNHAAIRAFAPAELGGDISIRYNWLRRIYAGIRVEGASAREALDASVVRVPGYADLGLNFEYRTSSRFGFWIEAGNLLGMNVEKHPGYVIPGQYITAGIVLKL